MAYTLKNIVNSPLKGFSISRISSDYGNRTFWNPITKKYDSNFHNGIDMTSGTDIVAVARGIVTASRNTVKGYTETYSSGNYVTLYHGGNIYSTYCHMEYGSVKLRKGTIVEKGEILGIKGSTGYSTGKHLHFGIKKDNNWVDPKPYLLASKVIPNYQDEQKELKYKIGDICIFTGVLYADSYGSKRGASKNNLTCKITKINSKGSKPYNINSGLGWVSEDNIIRKVEDLYYIKSNYSGSSIIDALKAINVNYSYNYRSKIASKNGISNYLGTASQNTKMLDLLKKGLLKRAD